MQRFGNDDREIRRYSVRAEAAFLDAVYQAFTRRPLFQRIVKRNANMQARVDAVLDGSRGYEKTRRLVRHLAKV